MSGDAFARFVVARFWDETAHWDDLDLAARHGLVGPWAARTPEGRRRIVATHAHFSRLLAHAAELVAALEQRGVPCVVLKGATAAAAWREPAFRPQVDIDLLVAPERLREAIDAWGPRVDRSIARAPVIPSEVEGWTCLDKLEERLVDRPRSLSPGHFHVTLSSRRLPDVPIELHHGLAIDFPLRVEIAALLAARSWVEVEGHRLPTLAIADRVTHLAVHAAAHAAQRLMWLFDLAELARAEVPWAAIVDTARRWGVEWPVWWALREAARRVRVDVPAEVLAALRPPISVRAGVRLSRLMPGRGESSPAARLLRLALVPPVEWPGVLSRKLRRRTGSKA